MKQYSECKHCYWWALVGVVLILGGVGMIAYGIVDLAQPQPDETPKGFPRGLIGE